uniref:Reverse transcriptase Ty1/copia-type domain-containing protein n=1 Tax=Solanum lycopersicum TaxID=4081 RepID=A0A3Q7J7B5_SOLLC
MAYILLYVDDIILTASSDKLHHSIISRLSSEFAMKDLRHLIYFWALQSLFMPDTVDFGLQIFPSSTSTLISYTDIDWGGCPDVQHRVTMSFWATLSRSRAEAEYRGVANVVSESCWLRNLLLELNFPIQQATLVYCDNVSAICLAGNPVQHQRTKHIEMDIHFVQEK